MSLLDGGFSDADILAQVRDLEPAVAMIADRIMLAGGATLEGGGKCGVVANVITGFILVAIVLAVFYPSYVSALLLKLAGFLKWASGGYLDVTGALTSLKDYVNYAWDAAKGFVGFGAKTHYVDASGIAHAAPAAAGYNHLAGHKFFTDAAGVVHSAPSSQFPQLAIAAPANMKDAVEASKAVSVHVHAAPALSGWAGRIWDMVQELFKHVGSMLGYATSEVKDFFDFSKGPYSAPIFNALSRVYSVLKIGSLYKIFTSLTQVVCDTLWGTETAKEKLVRVAAEAVVHARQKEVDDMVRRELAHLAGLPGTPKRSAKRSATRSPSRSAKRSAKRSATRSPSRSAKRTPSPVRVAPPAPQKPLRNVVYVYEEAHGREAYSPPPAPRKAAGHATPQRHTPERSSPRAPRKAAGHATPQRHTPERSSPRAPRKAAGHATPQRHTPERSSPRAPRKAHAGNDRAAAARKASPARGTPERKAPPAPKKASPKRKSPSPKRKSPSPKRKSPSPKRKSPPAPKKASPKRKSPSPKRKTPERKSPRAPKKPNAGDARVAAARARGRK
jgi:hypothetical protein